MNTETNQSQSNIRDEDIAGPYDSDYLKWKSWEHSSSFGHLRRQEKAYFSAELKRAKRSFSPHSKVLEIGFGEGSFLQYSAKRKWEIFGAEVNEHLVKVALNSGFNVIHSDNLRDYGDDFFDLVVAFDVMEHIPQNSLTEFINEVKRVLKVGGVFIARVPNGDSPFGLLNQNGDVTHITTIGSGKAHYFAKKCGMEVVFLGGEAQPLSGDTLLGVTHRIISLPIKKLLHIVTNLVFFPRSDISFYSSNLTLIFKKPN